MGSLSKLSVQAKVLAGPTMGPLKSTEDGWVGLKPRNQSEARE
jgi:hypothetical protein